MKIPANHFDFSAILPMISNLEELIICYKVGVAHKWRHTHFWIFLFAFLFYMSDVQPIRHVPHVANGFVYMYTEFQNLNIFDTALMVFKFLKNVHFCAKNIIRL